MIATLRWPSMASAAAAALCGAAAAAMAQPVPATLQACMRITPDRERLACFDREIAALSSGAASGAATPRPAAAAPAPTVPAAAAAASAPAAAAANAPAAAAANAPAARAPAAAAVAIPAAGSSATSVASAAPAGAAVASLTPEQEFGLSAEGIRKLEARQRIGTAEVKVPKELAAHIANVSRNSAGRAVFTLDNGQVWRQSETRPSFEAHAGDAVSIHAGAVGSFWLATNTNNWTRVERIP